ncbi:MAG: ABC transporter ATP-binding protein [Candidatus Caldatribacteriaceae bacterium]
MQPLVEVQSLHKRFVVSGAGWGKVATVDALNDVSLTILRGETLGLVGETGCGKSTLARCILRLLEPTEGKVFFDGQDVLALSPKEFKSFRRRMQIVFQDPFASLDPRKSAYWSIEEPLVIHGEKDKRMRRRKVEEIAERVGLEAASLGNYPHEFSGGQRQRIAIARALVLEPDFLVCDEPVSALDVSIQAQILNLFEDLQKALHLTYLFISHDLSVVRHVSHRVAVMYLGKIVEVAPTEELFAHPLHPYTQALLSSIPLPDPFKKKERFLLEGDPPSPINPPSGCRFHTRCPHRMDVCSLSPPRGSIANQEHIVFCHLYR